MLTLCIPTLRRYDLLVKCILSAENGTYVPDRYLIVDNGGKFRIEDYHPTISEKIDVVTPGYNLGVAAAWNLMIKQTDDIRIICNDDVKFYDNTIFVMCHNFDRSKIIFPGQMERTNAFSCFLLPNYVVEKIGLFDETISPNYAYFEDNDYDFRIREQSEIGFYDVACGYEHYGSATIRSMSKKEHDEHNRKFELARANFRKKWGRLP